MQTLFKSSPTPNPDKILGIIGGVSWHSSIEYYRLLNENTAKRLGAKHSARLILNSLDFSNLLEWQKSKDQRDLLNGFIEAGQALRASGCQAFAIASHTLSCLGEQVEQETGLVHISLYDALFRRLRFLGARRVALLGTLQTMTEEKYQRIYSDAGFEVIVPVEPHLSNTARIVYREITRGIFNPKSRNAFIDCIDSLAQKNVDAVVLGCTEIGLLVRERMLDSLPLVDLIEPHVEDCVNWLCT